MLSCDLRRMVAVALVFGVTFITMPVSAADFSTAKSPIGSVSAVGPVELRGIGISQEGTLFAGDTIRAGNKGYAKVLLGTGSKIELSEKTGVSISRDAQGVKIAMNAGTVGFSAHTPLRIDIMPFEITASDDAAGHVAIMSSTTGGVRAVNGKVTVRNLKTSESFVVLKGQERLLGLQNGIHAPALAQVASSVPGPVPAPVPQTPAGKTTGGLAMDTGAWLAVIGGAALAGVAIWGLVIAMDTQDDIDGLKDTISAQNTAIKNISNAASIANAASQLQAQQATVAALAAQANAALRIAGNNAAAATAANIQAQSAQISQQLNALQGQISAAQAALASGGGSSSTLTSLLQQEETLRAAGNALTQQLNLLLSQNGSTPGVPNTSVGTVGPPAVASASVPL